MCAKSTPCAASQGLEYLEASKVIHSLDLPANTFLRVLVDFLVVVVVAKSPVISTSSLLEKSIVTLVLPDDATFGLLYRIEALLHDFGFHVDKYCVSLESFRSFFDAPEVCL